MATCRIVLNLLAMVVAVAGPMPLWLHHATCHGTGCADHRASSETHTGCDGHHACHAHHGAAAEEESAEHGSESARVVAAHAPHACFICFQLAQSSMASSAIAAGVAVPVATTSPKRIEPIYIDAVGGPNPPRGPPGGSHSC